MTHLTQAQDQEPSEQPHVPRPISNEEMDMLKTAVFGEKNGEKKGIAPEKREARNDKY